MAMASVLKAYLCKNNALAIKHAYMHALHVSMLTI